MIEKSFDLKNEEIVSDNFSLILIDDLINLSSIEDLENIFNFFEKNLENFKIDKLIIFNMCKRIQKRLSKSNHIILCSKILLFLSKIFSISERSFLNLNGLFNTSNVINIESSTSKNEKEEGKLKEPIKFFLKSDWWFERKILQ